MKSPECDDRCQRKSTNSFDTAFVPTASETISTNFAVKNWVPGAGC